MRTFIAPRSRRIMVVAVVLFAVAGGAAYATIPDAAGVYTACKLRITGTIRLIDKTPGAFPAGSLLARCTSFEDEITWSHTGPQGIQGIQGPQGIQGQQGLKGDQGEPGAPATLSNLNVFYTSPGSFDLGSRDTGTAYAYCPSGSVRISGGFSSRDTTIHESAPYQLADGTQGWRATGTADFALISSDAWIQAWVVCLRTN